MEADAVDDADAAAPARVLRHQEVAHPVPDYALRLWRQVFRAPTLDRYGDAGRHRPAVSRLHVGDLASQDDLARSEEPLTVGRGLLDQLPDPIIFERRTRLMDLRCTVDAFSSCSSVTRLRR